MPKVTIDLPDIDGYTYTGELRKPQEGEYYLHANWQFGAIKAGFCPPPARRYILKKSRWRASYCKIYYYVDSDLVVEAITDRRSSVDDRRFSTGNYFRLKNDAEQFIEKVKAVFKENL